MREFSGAFPGTRTRGSKKLWTSFAAHTPSTSPGIGELLDLV
jgi:hypothetical protein